MRLLPRGPPETVGQKDYVDSPGVAATMAEPGLGNNEAGLDRRMCASILPSVVWKDTQRQSSRTGHVTSGFFRSQRQIYVLTVLVYRPEQCWSLSITKPASRTPIFPSALREESVFIFAILPFSFP